MASSQVEIASSSPFGSVLKDRNRHDRCSRENNARAAAAFQKSLKELVRDHLHTCTSVSSDSASDENSMNENRRFDCDLRMTNAQDARIKNADSFLNMSIKKANLLDQWAARQARDVVSTIERQREESGHFISSSRTPSTQKSSENSGISPGSENLGASSLVQIWEARLNRSPRTNNNPNPLAGAIRTSSGSCSDETVSEEKSRNSSMNNNLNPVAEASRTISCYSSNETASDEKSRHPDITGSATNENSVADTDSISQSEPSSMQFRRLDEGRQERVGIADIIRRLTSDPSDQGQQGNGVGDGQSRERSLAPGSQQAEHKALSQVVSPPRIRGRQAFNNLLSQMEQERQRDIRSLAERQAVSKFTHRGRIQSMLRLRFLQRGMAIQDKQRPQSSGSTSSTDTSRSQGSTIMHLRERFTAGIEQAVNEVAVPRGTADMVNRSVKITNSSAHNQLTDDGPHRETTIAEDQSRTPVEESLSQKCDVHEHVNTESIGSTHVTWQGTNLEVENVNPHGTSEAAPSWDEWDVHEIEVADEQQHFVETTYDWFSDIARPRSYWENQRQAWYQEKLSSSSDNDEIRQLLERRNVSSFLASDLREKIDELMVARAQIQVNQEEELEQASQERMRHLILSHFRRCSHPACDQEEEGQQEEEVHDGGEEGDAEEENLVEEQASEEEEIESPISHQYPEATDYFDPSSPPMHSPYTYRSRNYREDPTTTSRSPISHSSFEMEVVHDLKGHMEQLQREMSELRKSIQTCMGMQVNLQKSLNQEIREGQADGKILLEGSTKKRNCCICYKKKVDSFLYRCGHMCTCLKCARKLHESNGTCPMCGAPILDVVKAHMDS